MTNPTVSVILPTFARPHLLGRAIRSVCKQEYRDLELVIVADGPADDMTKRIVEAETMRLDHRFCELGQNWSRKTWRCNRGSVARLVGTYLARGKYLCYLDDDDAYLPNHVATLAHMLGEGLEIAYGVLEILEDGKKVGECGSWPPQCGGIGAGSIMHRSTLCHRANWSPHYGNDDWGLIQAWIDAGAEIGFTPTVTYSRHGTKAAARPAGLETG